MRDSLNKEGYNKEEEYFYKLNQELIDKRRKEKENAEKNAHKNHAHWMKCPKCGNGLKEVSLAGIQIDQCESCHGIFFDAGELDILMKTNEPKGFFSSMKKLF